MKLERLSWIVPCKSTAHLDQDCWRREVTLARRSGKQGLRADRQVAIAIEFDGVKFDEGLRADLIVEEKVIIELKSVEKVSAAHNTAD